MYDPWSRNDLLEECVVLQVHYDIPSPFAELSGCWNKKGSQYHVLGSRPMRLSQLAPIRLDEKRVIWALLPRLIMMELEGNGKTSHEGHRESTSFFRCLSQMASFRSSTVHFVMGSLFFLLI